MREREGRREERIEVYTEKCKGRKAKGIEEFVIFLYHTTWGSSDLAVFFFFFSVIFFFTPLLEGSCQATTT